MTDRLEKSEFLTGMAAALPVVIGYLPIAVAFGVIGRQAGVPLPHLVLMSALVYAGASQFMAVNMLIMGTGFTEIVLATFVLNFRLFVMSLSLMNVIRQSPGLRKFLLSFWVTDETFAVASLRREETGPRFFSGLAFAAYAAWVAGTLLGGLLSGVMPPGLGASMSIALYAMFIGILIPAVRGLWRAGVVAAASMFINAVLNTFVSSGWSIVTAAVLGSLIGVFLREVKPGEG